MPDRPEEWIRAAGLPAYKEGEASVHFHTHLDIFVDGLPVPVPSDLGLHPPFSSLHTHSASGILHVESAKAATFTLGDVFTLWGVRMDATCVGGYCAPGHPITVYVDGEVQPGPARDVRLAPFRQIALVIGRPPSIVPASYDCHSAAPVETESCQGFLS